MPTKAFLPLGIGYLILSLIGASFFRNTPTGYQVPGFSPATSGPVVDSGKDYTEKEALRTPQRARDLQRRRPDRVGRGL